MSFGGGALASKAAAGFVAAAIVTAGAVEVEHVRESSGRSTPATEASVTPPGDDRPAAGPLADAEDGQVVPGEEPADIEDEDAAAEADGDEEKDASEGDEEGTKEGEDATKKGAGAKDAPAAPGTPAAGTAPSGTSAQPAPPREEHGHATVALPPHPPEVDVEPTPESASPGGGSGGSAGDEEGGGVSVPETGVDAVDDASPALP